MATMNCCDGFRITVRVEDRFLHATAEQHFQKRLYVSSGENKNDMLLYDIYLDSAEFSTNIGSLMDADEFVRCIQHYYDNAQLQVDCFGKIMSIGNFTQLKEQWQVIRHFVSDEYEEVSEVKEYLTVFEERISDEPMLKADLQQFSALGLLFFQLPGKQSMQTRSIHTGNEVLEIDENVVLAPVQPENNKERTFSITGRLKEETEKDNHIRLLAYDGSVTFDCSCHYAVKTAIELWLEYKGKSRSRKITYELIRL